VLVVNAGSSSVKLSLLDGGDRTLAEQEISTADKGGWPDEGDLRAALASPLADADAVGHRIVHGGERFRGPTLIDAAVERGLRALTELAPLHQPRSLRALDLVRAVLPELPAVACFDTAFHASIPPAAATYALPAEWRERHGLRRYGFHGLSHAWAARRCAQLLGRDPAQLAIVSCHLGAGASLCAVDGGRSCDTTMGFTPLEGLVMATRSGSVDPGMLLWLMERESLQPRDVEAALEHRSGLLALAGSADMRDVLARREQSDARASLAFEVYVHSLRAHIAAMAAALGRLDALVFTGGVGERSPAVRAAAAERLGFLGVVIDGERNAAAAGIDADVSADRASVRTLVIRAREDIEIAGQVRGVLEQRRS
jgi:acetate kinase